MKINCKNIEFTSTRNAKLKIPFWQSVVEGLAKDGGLLVPICFPKISSKVFSNKNWWAKSKPADFAFLILRLFTPASEISNKDLKDDILNALDFKMPLEKLKDNNFVLRIDRGPTASFKDVAARIFGKLMNRYAEIYNKKINIVVATSGDTGVAIADAFGESKNITVTVLYPAFGVSSIQKKQMVEAHRKYKNEQVIPIKGNFDNCQDIAKLLLMARGISKLNKKAKKDFIKDAKIKLKILLNNKNIDNVLDIVSSLNLSSANSINIWRLIPQITQYFVSYGVLVRNREIKVGERVVFSIPTGNAGHLMAGIYAKEIGLPIDKFILGTNTNNILANIVGDGVIRHRPFTSSSAPSMDILDPSNLERLLHFAFLKTGEKKKIDFNRMKADIKNISSLKSIPLLKYGVSEKMLEFLREFIWAEDVETDEEIYAMMQHVYEKEKTVFEPHGITGYIAAQRARTKRIVDRKQKIVIFETAHPDKFPNALQYSGLEKSKYIKHFALSKLSKIDLVKMGVPKAEKIGLFNVVKMIKRLGDTIKRQKVIL